jgi:hypothetical protein
MSQLARLIEQAKNQKGLDDLFAGQTVSRVDGKTLSSDNTSRSLISKLDELEVQLFPCIHLSSSNLNEMIKTLESVRDDL